MTYRIKIISLMLFCLGIVLAGYVMDNSFKFGVCPWGGACIASFKRIGIPLPILFGSVFVSLLLLLPAKEAVFKTWFKFAIAYIPLSIFLIYSLKKSCQSYLFCIDKKEYAVFFAVIYLIISLLIIIIKSIRLAGKTEVAKMNENRK